MADGADAIQGEKIKQTIMGLESFLGKSTTEHMLIELQNNGFDFSNESEARYMHEIQEFLEPIWGKEMTAFVIQKLSSESSSC